ncbi:MAG: metallopeptidase family protein [Kineosporiaceae bacterium]
MTASLPGPDAPRPRGRRRERHGRDLRGSLLPPEAPAWRSRSARFDEQVLDTVEDVEQRLGRALDEVEFAVEDVPGGDPAPWEDEVVPLGRLFGGDGRHPARIVVYRRPVEARATGPRERAELIHEVVVEQVAHLLGLAPEQVDPGYDAD